MCGIAGIYQFEPDWSGDEIGHHLASMAQSLAHRGPDGEGIWRSEDGLVGLAHRRLSIIDLSPAGSQPMWSHDRRFCITFNGEIYNYRELREELRRLGATIRGDSDTEVLIESYRAFGPACLERLDGMFAFAIYDSDSRELFAARDPFGEKPLYYSLCSRRFTFASELDALRAVPGFDETVVPDAVEGFLALQYFDGECTPFRNARKLKPGHYARLSIDGRLEIKRYFEFSPIGEPSNRSIDDWADELEDLLVTSLARRLRADVPVGAFLSAGVDSSTVVALAVRRLGIPLKTFTIGFEGFEGSEHLEAAQIAAHLGVEHHQRLLAPDELDIAGRIAMLVDEPNGDTSLLPTYVLSRFAREQVKVALSGDGADELFGGYGRYLQMLAEERLIGDPGSAGRRYYSNRILVMNEREVWGISAGHHHALNRSLQRLREEIDSYRGDLMAKLRRSDVEHYLPGAVLAKVDRMSMRHGLEVRTPFLGIALARFAERIPSDLLANGGAGKLLLKHLASRYLPREWLERPKRGFGLPYHGWAGKNFLAQAVDRLVTKRDRSGWWAQRPGLAGWLESCSNQGAGNDYKLWNLLHLQGYLTSKGGVPPVDPDPAMAGSLRGELRRSDSCVVGLVTRAVNGWQTLFPQLDLLVALWDDGIEGVVAHDWLREPEGALAEAAQRLGGKIQCVVLLDRGGCDGPLASSLYARGVQWLLEYQGERWLRHSLASAQIRPPLPKLALIFDESEQRPLRFRPEEVFEQLRRRLVASRRKTPASASELFDSGPLLWRPDTPARAWQLVRELGAWCRFRLRERRLLSRLVKWRRDDGVRPAVTGGSRRIALIIGDLGSGGAERQLCNLAGALQARGHAVRLFTLLPLQGGAGHYASLLERLGIQVTNGGEVDERFVQAAGFEELAIAAEMIGQLPVYVRRHAWPLYSRLVIWKPDAVVAYLDYSNIIGGVAALLARTPRIVLSFRNHSPDHFEFWQPWFRRYYRTLAKSGRVVLSGNSEAGNGSYARWLALSPSRVQLVRNGIDFQTVRLPAKAEVEAIREEFALAGKRVILGIFRLSSEKRPLLFLQAVREAMRFRSDLKVLIIGEGPMRERVQSEIDRFRLHETVRLVGRRSDVNAFIGAADLVLQTALLEGTPNCLLEAQYLEVPVVTTAAGGAAEAVDHGGSGWVVESDTPEALAQAVLRVLGEPAEAKRMGAHGRRFVAERFSLEQLCDETLRLLGEEPRPERDPSHDAGQHPRSERQAQKEVA